MERKAEIERFSLPVGGVTDAEIANAIRYLDPEYANDERSGDPYRCSSGDLQFDRLAMVHLAFVAGSLKNGDVTEDKQKEEPIWA